MITVIGDLVVDLIVNHKGAHYGTDSESNISTYSGGQANHVAAWIAHSGADCTLIGRVGHDLYGDFLLQEADELGVKTVVEKDQFAETGKIIILVDEATGERSMFTDRGANVKLSVDQIERSEPVLSASSSLYISGYTLFQDETFQAVEKAKELAQASQVRIAVDPSSTYFLKVHKERLLAFINDVDFFFPNYEEGVLLTGESEPEAIVEALRQIVKFPILKLGSNGCMVYQDGPKRIDAKKVQVVDTTGAGDSFIGAFLAEYEKTKDLVGAAEFANGIAAVNVQTYGGRP